MKQLFPLIAGAAAMLMAVTAVAGESPAIILRHDVNIVVDPSGMRKVTTTVERKALTAEGVAYIRTITIPFNGRRGPLDIVSATVTGPDGKAVAVPQTDIRTSAYPGVDGAPAYQLAKVIRIQFPGVVEGSTVKVEYVDRQAQPFVAGGVSLFEVVDRSLPISEASVEVTAPSFMNLHLQDNNMTGGVNTSAAQPGMRTWSFHAANLPALTAVASVSQRLAQSPWVLVTSFDTQQQAAEAYLYRLHQPTSLSLELQYIADTVGKGIEDPQQLMTAYYGWIASHIRLIPLPLALANPSLRSAEDIYLSGYGTPEDRVVLLRALMRAKGISTDIVLVPGAPIYWKPMVAAVPAFYGKVLLSAPGHANVLDVGSQAVAVGQFAPSDRGKLGIRIASSGRVASFHVPEPEPGQMADDVTTSASLSADGTLTGTSTATAYGDLATAAARTFKTDSPLQIRSRITASAPAGAVVTLGGNGLIPEQPGVPVQGQEPYVFHAHYSVAGYAANQTPGMAKIPSTGPIKTPIGESIPVPRVVSALASLDEVARPGAPLCQPGLHSETTALALPFNADDIKLPSNVSAGSPAGPAQYTSNYSISDNVIYVSRALSIKVSPTHCSGSDEAAIEQVVGAMRKDLGQRIEVK